MGAVRAEGGDPHPGCGWGWRSRCSGSPLATEVWNGASFDTVGILAGIGAALMFSAYFLIGEHGVADLDPMRVFVWSFVVAAVCINLFAPLTGLDRDLLDDQASMLGALGAPPCAGLGAAALDRLVGTLVPFGLSCSRCATCLATTVTTVAMLEPIGVTRARLGVVRRVALTRLQIVGAVAVVVGIVLAQTSRLSRPADATVVPPVPSNLVSGSTTRPPGTAPGPGRGVRRAGWSGSGSRRRP